MSFHFDSFLLGMAAFAVVIKVARLLAGSDVWAWKAGGKSQ